MKRAECSNCSADARIVRDGYPFKETALPNVILRDVAIVRCDKCGNKDPIIPHVDDLMRTLALAVVGKPYRLSGSEVRFLRKYLKKTGDEFARLIHVDKTTLSKWENEHDPVGEQSDLLIRAVILALAEGLRPNVAEVVRDFEKIHKSCRRVRIEVDPETLAYQYA